MNVMLGQIYKEAQEWTAINQCCKANLHNSDLRTYQLAHGTKQATSPLQ